MTFGAFCLAENNSLVPEISQIRTVNQRNVGIICPRGWRVIPNFPIGFVQIPLYPWLR